MLPKLFVLFSIIFLYESKSADEPITPVILIPGICGSQVEAWYKKESAHYYCSKDSKGWTSLWLCLECMVPLAINCWIENIKLNTSDVRNLQNVNGVRTRVNNFGNTDAIGYLDKHHFVIQYENMIIDLEEMAGYERGVSIRGAPYDFRYTPNTKQGKDFLIKLRYLIEETYYINDENRVLLVAHSMGNPYLVNFLLSMDQAWKDKFIDSYVSLAGVFGGAAKAVRSLVSGETEGLPESIVSPEKMREFERSAPTVYWLMPTPSIWGDTPILFTPSRNYTAQEYKDILFDSQTDKGDELYDFAKETPLFDPDIGVDVYCIHGVGTQTPYQFQYNDKGFPDSQPTTLTSDGDGTVNLASLELCKKFKRLKDYKIIDGFLSTHLEILQRDDVASYIVNLLRKKNVALKQEKENYV